MPTLKKTPLHDTHLAMGAKMVAFGGWEMPIQYSNIIEEHKSVREQVGLFDVSHMGEVTVSGKDAEAFVNYLTTNDASALTPNSIQYSMMCNEAGGVVDDLLVYRKSQEEFLLIINAGNIDKDMSWIREAQGQVNLDVSVINISDDVGQVALQGPHAERLLQEWVSIDLSTLQFFKFQENVTIDGIPCLISRTGYTGEDGFEIYTDRHHILKVWDVLLAAGKKYQIKPCGLGARDTLRFEANLPLYGHELTETITPFEAGYGVSVKLDKENFIGKTALKQQKEVGVRRKIVGFQLMDKGIARANYPVMDEKGRTIGEVTTGYKSPTLDKVIGMALIDATYAKLDSPIFVQVRNKSLKATVISRKFLNKNNK